MAVEKNNEIIEEEARVTDEVVEQPEGSGPIDISVEGEEEVVEERPQDDFNANLAEDMDERTLQSMASDICRAPAGALQISTGRSTGRSC